jgi:hypothetical protein
MERYGAFWSIVEHYGALWSIMERYGALWRVMQRYGALTVEAARSKRRAVRGPSPHAAGRGVWPCPPAPWAGLRRDISMYWMQWA